MNGPSGASGQYRKTARNRLGRRPDRGHYDREAVHAVLDTGLLAHVGYVIDGQPFVTPTAYWREHSRVYWHGGAAGRMLKFQRDGVPVSFAVSHFDGLVMARSAFHHSVNYRSVIAFGDSRLVDDPAEKRRLLELFMERLAPGRWPDVRPPSNRELRLTSVMSLELDEVVVKVRAGPPVDDEADYALPVWAGVVPIETVVGEPMADPRLADGTATPRMLRRLVTN